MCAAVSPSPTENIGSGPSSISRSGRVRKKSSLLADYESLDGFEKPRKKHEKQEKPIKREKNAPTPKVTLKIGGGPEHTPGKRGPKKGSKRIKLDSFDVKASSIRHDMLDDDEEGDLEIDLPPEYGMEGNMPMHITAEEIIDEGLLDEEDGATEIAENTSINRLKSQAESTYFMEKSMEKSRKMGSTIHQPGSGQPGKIKQARKDKGSPRVTAYMLWAKEQRPHVVKKNPDLDHPSISKKLGELWGVVPPNQKKLWKNKASKIMKKNANLSENMKNSAPYKPKTGPPRPRGRKPKVKILHEESSTTTTKSSTISTIHPNSTTAAASSTVPVPNANSVSKNAKGKSKEPKLKGMKKKAAGSSSSLNTNSTAPNKIPKTPKTPKPSKTSSLNPPLTKGNKIITSATTTNGKASLGGGIGGGAKVKSKYNNNNNVPNRNFTPTKGRQSPKTAPQMNRNSTSGTNSSSTNNFALVSSEFTQQTNVQINKGDKKLSMGKVSNAHSNNVNVSTMQTSPSSSKFLHSSPSKYSPRKDEDSSLYKVTGTAPIDVAAHFSLLGESLTIIGERLKEHEGQTVSGSLSVLLDSLLCATGPLLCLTQQVPKLNCIPPEQLNNILDNIAYIMPGL